jgi:FAD/FMN-containing dehydrogenase
VFGHIGDGNIHIVTDVGADGTPRQVVDDLVYEATREAEGSISAEHGIGFQKLAWLGHTRSNEEVALMRLMKRSLDPKNLLSRGRVLAEAPQARG